MSNGVVIDERSGFDSIGTTYEDELRGAVLSGCGQGLKFQVSQVIRLPQWMIPDDKPKIFSKTKIKTIKCPEGFDQWWPRK
jgi:hypothetical protein